MPEIAATAVHKSLPSMFASTVSFNVGQIPGKTGEAHNSER